MFAAIDDSLFFRNGFYVYTHALIVDDNAPNILLFSGNKQEIYTHEKEIMEFLGSYIYDGCVLYACRHYSFYPELWKTFSPEEANNKNLPKLIRQAYSECHNAALLSAKKAFEANYSQKLNLSQNL
jgi:hypothetical protein